MSVGAVNKQTGDRIPTAGMTVVDSVLSGSSTNPVQNRVVKAGLDEKADTDIVASDFDATASYTAGDYCIYDGKFYKFKASHSGAWSAADVDEIKIAGELSSLRSGLTRVSSRLVSMFTSYDASSNVFPIPDTSKPYEGQVVCAGRNLSTGAIYLLWYDSGSHGFRIGVTVSGNAPSNGESVTIQYFS